MAITPRPADDGYYRAHAFGCTDEYNHPGSCRVDYGQRRGSKLAYDIVAQLPATEDDGSDLISLVDIVVTGIETPWMNFRVQDYDYRADGVSKPWATLVGLEDNESGNRDTATLTADVVRRAAELYIDSRLQSGLPVTEAMQLVDGSYTDAVIADSILQFALYGKEVYG